MAMPGSEGDGGRVRLDKWLWAARFYKMRSLAVDAIASGKITVRSERVKPAKLIEAGDEIRIRLRPYEHVVIVRALSERRRPASLRPTPSEQNAANLAARR